MRRWPPDTGTSGGDAHLIEQGGRSRARAPTLYDDLTRGRRPPGPPTTLARAARTSKETGNGAGFFATDRTRFHARHPPRRARRRRHGGRPCRRRDRKSAVEGRSMAGRVDLGGRRSTKKKQHEQIEQSNNCLL